MQLLNERGKFDTKKVEDFLRNENKFISEIFAVISIPERKDFNGSDEEEEGEEQHKPNFSRKGNKTSRAKSLQELQQRLQAITSKKRLSYKEKLTKKGLKNRMKKKSQQDERNAQKKLLRAEKLSAKEDINRKENNKEEEIVKDPIEKPIFNKEDKMVFSKFDFANLGKEKKIRIEKDPKKLLKKIGEENEKLMKLTESGQTEKAALIKEKTAWKNALAKAEGQKVRDDPALLKKSLKKKEQKQRSSKKKWAQRVEGVEKAKEERQQKRMENIQKKKKEKKNKKLKKAVKKGKVIPGF